MSTIQPQIQYIYLNRCRPYENELRYQLFQKYVELGFSDRFGKRFSDEKSTQTDLEVITLFKAVSKLNYLSSSSSESTLFNSKTTADSETILDSRKSEPSCTSDHSFVDHCTQIFEAFFNSPEIVNKKKKALYTLHKPYPYTIEEVYGMMNDFAKFKYDTNLETSSSNFLEECPFYETVLQKQQCENNKQTVSSKSFEIATKHFKLLKQNLKISNIVPKDKRKNIVNKEVSTQTDKSYLRTRKKMLLDKRLKQKGRCYLQSLQNFGIISTGY